MTTIYYYKESILAVVDKQVIERGVDRTLGFKRRRSSRDRVRDGRKSVHALENIDELLFGCLDTEPVIGPFKEQHSRTAIRLDTDRVRFTNRRVTTTERIRKRPCYTETSQKCNKGRCESKQSKLVGIEVVGCGCEHIFAMS